MANAVAEAYPALRGLCIILVSIAIEFHLMTRNSEVLGRLAQW